MCSKILSQKVVSALGKVIAMYMRLSVADDDFEEDESNSIKAQRDLIYQYISEKEEFKDYEIEFVSNNTELVDANGRVVKAPEFATSVSYTITVEKDGQVVEEITLGSLIPGVYEKK